MRRMVAATALLLGLAASAGADERDAPAWLTALRLRGRVAEEFAYRLHDPGDVSKLKTLGWLEGKYTFTDAVALRAAVRGWYDAVFDATDRYPANVERDQKTQVSLREALLTVGHGDFDVRLGRQQIVWGEAISVFVTDVVNPKDLREFVLPDFSELRIPIWAVDATYRLAEGVSVEGVWTPDTMPNRLPKQAPSSSSRGRAFASTIPSCGSRTIRTSSASSAARAGCVCRCCGGAGTSRSSTTTRPT